MSALRASLLQGLKDLGAQPYILSGVVYSFTLPSGLWVYSTDGIPSLLDVTPAMVRGGYFKGNMAQYAEAVGEFVKTINGVKQ